MKTHLKRILCLALTLAIVFTTTAVCYADSEKCSCKNIPVVHVDGIGGALFLQNEDGSREQVFPPETDSVVKALLRILPFLPLASFSGDWSIFERALSLSAGQLFEVLRCDPDGNSVYNIQPNPCDEVKRSTHNNPDKRYNFSYDWRLDPLKTAAELDKYIDKVRSVTGHDKVILESYSEGGEICLAYIGAYGGGKIEKYITRCAAFQGVSVVGYIFTGKMRVDAEQTVNFLSTIIPTMLGENETLTNTVKVLKVTGILSALCKLANRFIEGNFDGFFEHFALPYFGYMLGVVDFTPDEFYSEVRTKYAEKPYHKVYLEKMDNYHEIQKNAKTVLTEAVEGGMKICIVSNYGCYVMPFVGNNAYQSDGLIDSAKSSGGVTFAPVGQTLGANYTQKVNDGHNHLAPDGSADASTCMFPEYTWLVNGFCHWNSPSDLMKWLIRYDGQPTVFTDSRYPQFSLGNPNDSTTAPMK
ncbi:MAG TPA: hypothetical protein DDY98_07560 [Ruminococcaceae bacterium]|nr:hypothetical protein [Oscillospiraceae bacterium]